MQSYVHAYQSYEQRILRGELDVLRSRKIRTMKVFRLPLTYRIGDILVRFGLKLKQQAATGHTLTSTTMAGK